MTQPFGIGGGHRHANSQREHLGNGVYRSAAPANSRVLSGAALAGNGGGLPSGVLLAFFSVAQRQKKKMVSMLPDLVTGLQTISYLVPLATRQITRRRLDITCVLVSPCRPISPRSLY